MHYNLGVACDITLTITAEVPTKLQQSKMGPKSFPNRLEVLLLHLIGF